MKSILHNAKVWHRALTRHNGMSEVVAMRMLDAAGITSEDSSRALYSSWADLLFKRQIDCVLKSLSTFIKCNS